MYIIKLVQFLPLTRFLLCAWIVSLNVLSGFPRGQYQRQLCQILEWWKHLHCHCHCPLWKLYCKKYLGCAESSRVVLNLHHLQQEHKPGDLDLRMPSKGQNGT